MDKIDNLQGRHAANDSEITAASSATYCMSDVRGEVRSIQSLSSPRIYLPIKAFWTRDVRGEVRSMQSLSSPRIYQPIEWVMSEEKWEAYNHYRAQGFINLLNEWCQRRSEKHAIIMEPKDLSANKSPRGNKSLGGAEAFIRGSFIADKSGGERFYVLISTPNVLITIWNQWQPTSIMTSKSRVAPQSPLLYFLSGLRPRTKISKTTYVIPRAFFLRQSGFALAGGPAKPSIFHARSSFLSFSFSKFAKWNSTLRPTLLPATISSASILQQNIVFLFSFTIT